MDNDSQSDFQSQPQVEGYGEDEEPMVFYHKRGEYRQYESETYRATAEGRNSPRKGMFGVLVSTKGNKSLFIIMCITFAVTILVWLFARSPDESVLSGVDFNVKAMSVNETVYCVLTADVHESRKQKQKVLLEKPVEYKATFVLLDENKGKLYTQTEEYVFEGTLQKNTLPFNDYDVKNVECTVETSDGSITLKTKVIQ